MMKINLTKYFLLSTDLIFALFYGAHCTLWHALGTELKPRHLSLVITLIGGNRKVCPKI